MGEIVHCAPVTYPRLTPKKKYSHVCDYTNICPVAHTEIRTLDSTLGRCFVGFGTPLFSGALRGNSWIDDMRLWTPCRIVGRLLDRFNEKVSLWQREEASLRKTIMQYEYGLRIIVVEVLSNSLITLCSQETQNLCCLWEQWSYAVWISNSILNLILCCYTSSGCENKRHLWLLECFCV